MRQPQIMPIGTWVPPASRGHIALMVFCTAVWPAVVVASCKGRIGTGQPWFGPLNLSQSVTTFPCTSVVFVWPRIEPVLGTQLLMPPSKPPWPERHQKGYHFKVLTGSDTSGSATPELMTPETPLFSSLLVGSTTQPIQLSAAWSVPLPSGVLAFGSKGIGS